MVSESKAIDTRNRHSSTTPDLPQDIYQLSNLPKNQLWFWIGQNLDPETPIFNMPMAITIAGEVDHQRFNRAFSEVLKRSDALRTVIETQDGIPQRRVLEQVDYKVEYLDFSAAEDPQSTFDEWANQRCRRNFDLAERMFDAVLVKLDAGKTVWYWCQHHLICDGWSTALVYRYVSSFYAADPDTWATLPDFPKYEAYVDREREYRHSAEHEASRKFWADELAEPLDSLSFYGKTTREHGINSVVRVTRNIGKRRTDGLKALAARRPFLSLSAHMSVFQLVTTCLLAYLHRITGNEIISIGSLYHNRQTPDDKNTVGFFMEMAPLRVAVAGDDSFEDLFGKIRDASHNVMKHYRFAPGNPMHNRSYDVALNYNNASYPPFAGMPMSIHWLHTGAWYAHEPLAVQIHDFGETGTLTAAFDFNSGMFDEDNQERVIAHFFNCIDALIDDSTQCIGDFSLLGDAERKRILQEFNHSTIAHVPEVTLHELVSRQAANTPETTAVSSSDHSYIYAELESRSNQLAGFLRSAGAKNGDLIGISMTRHPDMIVAMLGTLKAGCGYVPMDPEYPESRLAHMMKDSDIKVLITQSELLDQIPTPNSLVLKIDEDWDDVAVHSDKTVQVSASPGDLAYVIYTSGSTGQSKGVLIEHRAIVNYTLAAIADYNISASDKTLQLASISFDAAGEEIYPTLATGGTLHLADDRMFASARDFVEICEQEQLTFLDLPTAFWHQIAASMVEENLQLPECVRLVILGGERALPQYAASWLERDQSGCRLLNTYGPTETTIVATWCELSPQNTSANREVPIGRPVRNMSCYVLDKRLQPVPVGVSGELYIGGPGLARGYLNQPQLTAEKFIKNPFSDDPGARLYKSGDLVRFRRDGLLEYRDRVDDQVKVRGYRIELGEVESALMRIDGVENGAVLIREAQPGDKRIVAYYVLGAGRDMTPTEMRQNIKVHLPDYMIPQHFVEIDALPMTPNNKVDRKSLPNPLVDSTNIRANYVEPETDAEKRLAEIWTQLLATDNVSRHDNFFDAGGHSLLMMQLIATMSKKLGFTASPRMIVMQDLAQIALEYEKQCNHGSTAVRGDSAGPVSLMKKARNALRLLISR